MPFLSSKKHSNVGRPSKYNRAPRSLNKLYPMDIEEITHRVNLTKGVTHWVGYLSPSIEDMALCEAKRPALITFAENLLEAGKSPSIYIPDEVNLILVCMEDIQYFTDPDASSAPTGPTSPTDPKPQGSPGAGAQQEAHKPRKLIVPTDTSTSQPTEDFAKTNTYDPRLDRNSDVWDCYSDFIWDWEMDHGSFPCWRHQKTGEVAWIPTESKYHYLNNTPLESMSKAEMDRLSRQVSASSADSDSDSDDPNDIVPDEADPHSEDEAIRKYLQSKGKL